LADFERQILPHLDAAFSLARFLMRDAEDAEDVVQEASLRAFRFYESFRGGNSRAWFLSIVRNAAFTALKRNRADETNVVFDEELRRRGRADGSRDGIDRELDQRCAAIEELPPTGSGKSSPCASWRNVPTKRSRRIVGVPIGTVMSRLAAREHSTAFFRLTSEK
jgi:RNA polymerase sigma-70 factor (ECF subfamily)